MTRGPLVVVTLCALSLAACARQGTVASRDAQGSQERLKGAVSKPRNLVVGIRSFTGSRTALIGAAEELLASSPVIKRSGGASYSSAYLDSKESPKEFVAAGFAYKSALPVPQLAGLLHAVEERLADPADPQRRLTLRLELLWVAGEDVKSPQVTVPSPSIAEKRWAISALVEGGENEIVESINAGDEARATGKKFSHYYDTISGEPRWSGNIKDFSEPSLRRAKDGVDIRAEAVDLADALAVASDLLAIAEIDWRRHRTPAAKPQSDRDAVELATQALRAVVPEDVLPVEAPVAAGMSDDAKVGAWLRAVRAALAGQGAPLSRTVVFQIAASKIRGAVLVGKRAEGASVFHRDLQKATLTPNETPTRKTIDVVVHAADRAQAADRAPARP